MPTTNDIRAAFLDYFERHEHVADDAAELRRARQLLAAAGHLVVLAPAHQFLFSAFDAAIGHYRRYTRKSLVRLTPPGCLPDA